MWIEYLIFICTHNYVGDVVGKLILIYIIETNLNQVLDSNRSQIQNKNMGIKLTEFKNNIVYLMTTIQHHAEFGRPTDTNLDFLLQNKFLSHI